MKETVPRSGFVPAGWHTVTPRIVVDGAERFVGFLRQVFAATGEYRRDLPSVLRIGDSMVMVTDTGIRSPMTAFLYVYVDDVDATYRRAVDAGARSLEKPSDLPYGDRRCMVEDAWGNTWQIATQLRGQDPADPQRQPNDELFDAGAFRAVELGSKDIPGLQRFFELNPEYFLAVNGQPPTTHEADEEIHGTVPDGWAFTRKWIIGFLDGESLIGIANVVSDLLAPSIWHIGLFIVATRLHGSGTARVLYDQLECWALDRGARWLRLGVVEGNAQGERFWQKCGFVEVRKRHGVKMGTLVNTVRVMAKPLAAGRLPEYLSLVARDRPEAP